MDLQDRENGRFGFMVRVETVGVFSEVVARHGEGQAPTAAASFDLTVSASAL